MSVKYNFTTPNAKILPTLSLIWNNNIFYTFKPFQSHVAFVIVAPYFPEFFPFRSSTSCHRCWDARKVWSLKQVSAVNFFHTLLCLWPVHPTKRWCPYFLLQVGETAYGLRSVKDTLGLSKSPSLAKTEAGVLIEGKGWMRAVSS